MILNWLILIIFALSFALPKSLRDWRWFSMFCAIIVALLTRRYGFPSTIYLLLPWLTKLFCGVDSLSHNVGHSLEIFFGWRTNLHFEPLLLLSNLVIFGGFILLASAWRILYEAQTRYRLAATGIYTRIRYPQYIGFVLIMFGFELHWPALATPRMFRILVGAYGHLAKGEEQAIFARFGNQCLEHHNPTPRFVPAFSTKTERKPS